MLADYHLHSNFSEDSDCVMEDVIKQAIKLGFDEICMTDHVDYFEGRRSYLFDFDQYVAEIFRLRKVYGDQIGIRLVMELGVQAHTIARNQALVDKYPLDFALLSVHQVRDQELHTDEFQAGRSHLEYTREYYRELRDIILEFKDYSVLGHLDVIKRYGSWNPSDDADCEDIIREILDIVIQDKRGIELNASSFRYRLPDLTPSRSILEWYHEMGGTILTFGSDGHRVRQVGAHIDAVRQIAREIGFKEFCTFEGMQPIFHPIS